MTDRGMETHAYELIAEHLRLGGAPAQLPGWVAQTYVAVAEDLAAEARLLATIERHRRTGDRFVVKQSSEALEHGPGEAAYCVIDNEQRVQVLGPVTYEEASRRRDELMDAAIEAEEGGESLMAHLQAWHLRRTNNRATAAPGCEAVQDHRSDHRLSDRLALTPFPEHEDHDLCCDPPLGWQQGGETREQW